MSGEQDDQTLVHSAQRGDLECFNLLVERYADLLFRIALRMLGDEDSAQDAVQSAWISAFRKLTDFRGGHFKTWLARVVVNTCYDEIRARHRRREVALAPVRLPEMENDSIFWLADAAPSVEEQVDVNEFDEMLQACLQTLAPAYRSMLILVDVEGMSYEEAAVAARVPVGTVRSRLARARMALRGQLQSRSNWLPPRPRYQVGAPRAAGVKCP